MKKIYTLVALVASITIFASCEKDEIPTLDQIPPWKMINTVGEDSARVVYFRDEVPVDTFTVGMYTKLSPEELREDFYETENNLVVVLDQIYTSSKPADIIGWDDENGDKQNYE